MVAVGWLADGWNGVDRVLVDVIEVDSTVQRSSDKRAFLGVPGACGDLILVVCKNEAIVLLHFLVG